VNALAVIARVERASKTMQRWAIVMTGVRFRPMQRVIVRYRVKPDHAERNVELVRAV
jgi:hypothetical protein